MGPVNGPQSMVWGLGELWRARHACRLALPRTLFWRALLEGHARSLPYVLFVAGALGMLLFTSLATVLGSAHLAALLVLWKAWTQWIAPILVALVLVLNAAPLLASDLYHRQQDRGFDGLELLGFGPATFPMVPNLLAHAALAFLLTATALGFALVAGLVSGLVMNQGNVWSMLNAVLLAQSPLHYVLACAVSWFVVLLGMTAVCLYAWPGRLEFKARGGIQSLSTRAIRWALLGATVALLFVLTLRHLLGA